jgi:hypothetical protein
MSYYFSGRSVCESSRSYVEWVTGCPCTKGVPTLVGFLDCNFPGCLVGIAEVRRMLLDVGE